jgi:cytochrome c oxidase subunit 2
MRKVRFCLNHCAGLAGCRRQQSALDAEGRRRSSVEHLIIGIVIVCSVVWAS